jgi:hypothetical protein
MESTTRDCEDSLYQAGLKEIMLKAKTQQIVKYADSHFRTRKFKGERV